MMRRTSSCCVFEELCVDGSSRDVNVSDDRASDECRLDSHLRMERDSVRVMLVR